jgi:hypothetical protein
MILIANHHAETAYQWQVRDDKPDELTLAYLKKYFYSKPLFSPYVKPASSGLGKTQLAVDFCYSFEASSPWRRPDRWSSPVHENAIGQ